MEQLRELLGTVNFHRRSFLIVQICYCVSSTSSKASRKIARHHSATGSFVHLLTSSRCSKEQQCSCIQLLMQVWNFTRMHLTLQIEESYVKYLTRHANQSPFSRRNCKDRNQIRHIWSKTICNLLQHTPLEALFRRHELCCVYGSQTPDFHVQRKAR